jgi:hypothetical protein
MNKIQFMHISLSFHNTVFYFSTSQTPCVVYLRSLYEEVKMHA